MARILIKNEWFSELSPNALYESEFEDIVINEASKIFENFFVSEFKTNVTSEEDIAKPDLAIIDKQYRGWWVVEVEMNNHSFENHIIPQVKKLSKGDYGEPQVEYLCNKNTLLLKKQLFDMMKGTPPQVLVVLNKPMPTWKQVLSTLGVKICIVEVFRSDQNRYAFRVNGEYPVISTDYVSDCRLDKLIPRFLVVSSPAGLKISNGDTIQIQFENCITEWERIDCQNKVWLSPKRTNPLLENVTYKIIQVNNGPFVFVAK